MKFLDGDSRFFVSYPGIRPVQMELMKIYLFFMRTAGGERLLKVWLRQPLTDIQKIRERLGKVWILLVKF